MRPTVEELSEVCPDRLDANNAGGSLPMAGEIEGCAMCEDLNSPSPKLIGSDAAGLRPCSLRLSAKELPRSVILKILKINAI